MNSSKSSNPIVRAGATQLFKTVVSTVSSDADLKHALDEILALPKTGKTTGPDHRVALYTMLGNLPPSQAVSPTVVELCPALLAKEPHDGAISALAAALSQHFGYCLRENIAIPSTVQSMIAKEMVNIKPTLRYAFDVLAGSVIWDLNDITTPAASSFAQAVLPSLEAGLKTLTATPASSSAVPLEGYIATALLLGPYHRSGNFG